MAKPRASRAPKRVVLGISGSIAAYKACLIVRGLVKAGAEVRCVMTPTAREFVSPLTLAALSRGPVTTDLADPSLWDMAHLRLASWAERVLIAPATAELMARLAQGNAGSPVEAVVLSTKAPVAVAPAMETHMWEHPATRANARRLEEYGYEVWGPVDGPLASGKSGMGRMMEPDELVRRILA
jgi:phosphopantothenoylcysteine decarboxylase / phosphopantothenate---cysteine ligase